MNNFEISDKEMKQIVENFYFSFSDGYIFENFLKIYLESIGLDELEVTQKSGDGGIDLKGIKKGIDELTEIDSVKYFIQAKRYKPTSTIPIESVRALRGVLPDGYKGIFITTAAFSKRSYDFAINNESRALILIDGEKLVQSCIDKGFGFKWKPIFSKESLLALINKEKKNIDEQKKEMDVSFSNYLKKKISKNDIRARILRIPKTFLLKIPQEFDSFKVKFEGEQILNLNIDKYRTYFAGVTSAYRKYGLLMKDNSEIPMYSFWYFNRKENYIHIVFKK